MHQWNSRWDISYTMPKTIQSLFSHVLIRFHHDYRPLGRCYRDHSLLYRKSTRNNTVAVTLVLSRWQVYLSHICHCIFPLSVRPPVDYFASHRKPSVKYYWQDLTGLPRLYSKMHKSHQSVLLCVGQWDPSVSGRPYGDTLCYAKAPRAHMIAKRKQTLCWKQFNKNL